MRHLSSALQFKPHRRASEKPVAGFAPRKIILPDGTQAHLRFVRPGDERKLRAGFNRLSLQSRYRRFLHAKQKLTKPELRFLTHPDGEYHFALAVVKPGFLGIGARGIGVGRFVRLGAEPKSAEVALTIADEYQGRGVGKILLGYLTQTALEKRIERFVFYTLGDNRSMHHLLEKTGWAMDVNVVNGVMTIDAQITPSKYLSDALFAAQP